MSEDKEYKEYLRMCKKYKVVPTKLSYEDHYPLLNTYKTPNILKKKKGGDEK